MSEQAFKQGGGFIIEESGPQDVLTPEDFSQEQQMIRDTAAKFVAKEIQPVRGKIEKLDYPVIKSLLRQIGELGFLGISVPEDLGGAGLDKVSALIADEEFGRAGSFSVTYGAHTGIGTLPIVYFGTPEQKKKYVPRLVSGESAASFALTEPDCGSDALSLKTKAVLSPDKKYFILNGAKQFISNGAIAEVFIVFAKIDGEKLSCFIVERGFEGVSIGPEEKKMGIKGSSTTPVILTNVKVPVENLLGEAGKGTKIALNILNNGRLKLSAGCLGASKGTFVNILEYVSQRKQFGKAINEFGMIREKLADMAIRIFALESACYRTVGLIQRRVDGLNLPAAEREKGFLQAGHEYSIECAIMKVFGSEALDFVVDEGVQCLGGYGFIEEYPLERAYRDSRINRIFEGTNEINRLVILGMLIKKSLCGELKLMEAIRLVQKEMTELGDKSGPGEGFLEGEKQALSAAKKAFLLVAGAAAQKYGEALEEEQELMGRLADCVIDIYVLESALLRALKIAGAGGPEKAVLPASMVRIIAFEAVERISGRLKESAAFILAGDDLKILLGAIRRFTKTAPGNFRDLRRSIAKTMIEAGAYV